MLRQGLCNPPRLSALVSTISMLLFCVGICPESSGSSMQVSCHFYLTLSFLGWTALDVGGGDPGVLTSFLGLLFFPVPYPTVFFQADGWRGQRLLSWRPELWACFFWATLSSHRINSTISWSLQRTLLTLPELTMNHNPQIPFCRVMLHPHVLQSIRTSRNILFQVQNLALVLVNFYMVGDWPVFQSIKISL